MSSPATFEVIPLGVGNFFSTLRYNTSLLLIASGKQVLIDLPDPFFRMCAEASKASGREINPDQLDHIMITHIHGDHTNGLEAFGFWRKFVGKKGKVPTIHTTNAVADILWQKLSGSMAHAELPPDGEIQDFELKDYYRVERFEFGDTVEVCGIEFETRRTMHSVPCYGFRATHGGRRFGYSCDTYFDPEMIAFLEPCDLIFHECDFGMHTAQGSLEELPEPLRKKIRLIHLNDDFTGSTIEASEQGKVYRV